MMNETWLSVFIVGGGAGEESGWEGGREYIRWAISEVDRILDIFLSYFFYYLFIEIAWLAVGSVQFCWDLVK